MTKSRLFLLIASFAIVVFCVCGQPALAENPHHLQARLVSSGQAGPRAERVQGYDELFQLASGFGVLPPVDGSGFDEWPCFPNPANSNYPDCSTISNGGVVIGVPAYTWSYTACDGNSATSTNCGQIFWFYEDDTNDNTDPLIVSIEVKQGSDVILDTGNVTLANPNPFAPGSVIVISDDVTFGSLGETGKGNGECAGTKVICKDPLQGLAVVTVTTKVGPSKISNKFNINLQ